MRRPIGTVPLGAVLEVGVTRAGGFHGRIRHNHPDTESEEFAGSFYVFRHGRERCKDFVHFVFGGVL